MAVGPWLWLLARWRCRRSLDDQRTYLLGPRLLGPAVEAFPAMTRRGGVVASKTPPLPSSPEPAP
eukprot:8196229-Lingulodinium_polyedra.AAC.1